MSLLNKHPSNTFGDLRKIYVMDKKTHKAVRRLSYEEWALRDKRDEILWNDKSIDIPNKDIDSTFPYQK